MLAVALSALLGWVGLASPPPPVDAAARGRLIYRTGVTARGEALWAQVGQAGTRVPATALPCAGCHGHDGKGRPEGGLVPPDLRWSVLTKPYGHAHQGGRRHGKFDEASLGRAVKAGVDPAGNALHSGMPRYALSDSDISDLAAYLGRLETETDPGVGPGVVRVGVLLPRSDAGPLARVLRQTVQAQLTALPPIHGRQVEAVFVEGGPAHGETLRAARQLLEGGQVFALLGGTPGADLAEITAAAEALGVPVVAPLLTGNAVAVGGDHTFHLFGGLETQAQIAAADHGGPLGVLAAAPLGDYPTADPATGAAAASTLRAAGATALFHAGSVESLRVLFADTPWRPTVYLPAARIEGLFRLPPDLPVRVIFPALPRDQSRAGRRALSRAGGVNAVSALTHAGTQVFAEGLRRAGRDLTRERFTHELATLSGLQTGVSRPVSYGPARRVGVRGGYLAAVDHSNKGFAPNPVWVGLKE